MDSESEVLGYGISLIILNLGMYLGVPAIVIVGIKIKFSNFTQLCHTFPLSILIIIEIVIHFPYS